jgi:hypothetical protein
MQDWTHLIEILERLKDKGFCKVVQLIADYQYWYTPQGFLLIINREKDSQTMFQFPSFLHQLISNGSIP